MCGATALMSYFSRVRLLGLMGGGLFSTLA